MPETITRLARADGPMQSILGHHAGLGPRDEDLAFIVEGLHEVTDFYYEISDLLSSLAALADTPDLPPALRPFIERAYELTLVHQARLDGLALRACR